VEADNPFIMVIPQILKGRQRAIYQEDIGKPIRKSHENPSIIKLYEEFLGKPLGEKGSSPAAYKIFPQGKSVICIEPDIKEMQNKTNSIKI
jgi:hypothetical protein